MERKLRPFILLAALLSPLAGGADAGPGHGAGWHVLLIHTTGDHVGVEIRADFSGVGVVSVSLYDATGRHLGTQAALRDTDYPSTTYAYGISPEQLHLDVGRRGERGAGAGIALNEPSANESLDGAFYLVLYAAGDVMSRNVSVHLTGTAVVLDQTAGEGTYFVRPDDFRDGSGAGGTVPQLGIHAASSGRHSFHVRNLLVGALGLGALGPIGYSEHTLVLPTGAEARCGCLFTNITGEGVLGEGAYTIRRTEVALHPVHRHGPSSTVPTSGFPGSLMTRRGSP